MMENAGFDSAPERGQTRVAPAAAANSKEGVSFRSYKRRWFMLFVVIALNLSNAMLWISFAPVANFTNFFYCAPGEKCEAELWLTMIFMIVTIPIGFLAMWGVDKFGLRPGILIGSCVNCLGAAIRVISSIHAIPVSARFPLALAGQGLAATAQPFIMYLPPKLAGLWFPQNQRATANTAGSMSNPLGILLAMLISPALVRSADHILIMNGVMLAPALATAIVASVGVRSSLPPTPPTASAADDSLPFWQGFKNIRRMKAFWVLWFCLGGGMGVFNALYTLIQPVLCPKGYSNSFAGLCGALLIIGGLVGSAAAGLLVDRTGWFQEVAKVCFSLAAVAACAISVLTLMADTRIWIGVAMTFFGFFGFATYPIGLEMGVECTYPIAEATSSGLIIISGQIQGIIYTLLMQEVLSGAPSAGDLARQTCHEGAAEVVVRSWKYSNMFMAAITCLLSLVLTAFFWPKYKRRLAESKKTTAPAVTLASARVFPDRQVTAF